LARIVLGSYMVRYPLGGMMSWVLQYLVGLKQLGHDVYFVEKAGWSESCYDPSKEIMTNDCTFGVGVVNALLKRHSLGDEWCFVDYYGKYHGLERSQIESVFKEADVFIDMGTHGTWHEEASHASARVTIDGDPAFTQIKMIRELDENDLAAYDWYFTTGRNLPAGWSSVPEAGVDWLPIFHPVVTDLFEHSSAPGTAYTTIMNWQSYERMEFDGVVYGHKDMQFPKFEQLPQLVDPPVEVAVSGAGVPTQRLEEIGWSVIDAHRVTASFDVFRHYISSSRGEFGVCKHGYVRSRSGWFSDRSAAYLASGRPVVLEETGFSDHLPCGEGLFAVSSLEEAVMAIEEIENDYGRHSRAARAIAKEHLEATSVLKAALSEIGL
jgi:hypothetical protein